MNMIEITSKIKFKVECPFCGTVYTHDPTDFIDMYSYNYITSCIEIIKGTKCPACNENIGFWRSQRMKTTSLKH